MLSSNRANRVISSMSLVEVAHLWRLSAASPTKTLIEIGRERGGSTFVMAAAMPGDATLYSYDPQSKHGSAGQLFDRQIKDALARYALDERVHIVEESSATGASPPGTYGVVLVDGDRSYTGLRSDYERFCRHLASKAGHSSTTPSATASISESWRRSSVSSRRTRRSNGNPTSARSPTSGVRPETALGRGATGPFHDSECRAACPGRFR